MQAAGGARLMDEVAAYGGGEGREGEEDVMCDGDCGPWPQ